jgi:hypothetical protein
VTYSSDQILFFIASIAFWLLVIVWALRRIFRVERGD